MTPEPRIMLRPLGNPLPLGFLALAGGTLLVAGLQLEWLQPTDGAQVGMILVAFVFPLQLVASVFGFLARDVVAGTGMGLLAGTWLSIGLITLTGQPGATSDALGLFLLLAAIAMLVPARRLPASSSPPRYSRRRRCASRPPASTSSPPPTGGRPRPGSSGSRSAHWPSTPPSPWRSRTQADVPCSRWAGEPISTPSPESANSSRPSIVAAAGAVRGSHWQAAAREVPHAD
jgi:hypothetical protein